MLGGMPGMRDTALLEHCPNGLVEYGFEALLSESAALDILDRPEPPRQVLGLSAVHGALALGLHPVFYLRVVTQILLETYTHRDAIEPLVGETTHASMRQKKAEKKAARLSVRTDKKERGLGAVVLDFVVPLVADVLKGRTACEREGNQEDVCLGIRERAEAIY